ncbi:MAG: type II toxin-antitoxin system Phd/YefM family antitoxin [Beijerinckiaceae bacterium]|nr:type II toxin-antitoxin system Phd/YefM family antitoxin [Beijerinckiaceae bacterium]
MLTITAAELQKKFGRYRDAAIRQPVAVTHHGRESLVLLSAEEYARLKSFDDRKAYYPWELPDDAVKALDSVEISEASAQFDHEYK